MGLARTNSGEKRAAPLGPGPDPLAVVARLSLPARTAVALHLFAGYCRARGLDHPAIGRYLDFMWGYPAVGGGRLDFGEWQRGETELARAWIYDDGPDYPDGLAAHLADRGVPELEFRTALVAATEVVYGSTYSAADDRGSLQAVATVADIALAAGAGWPELSVFAGWWWADDRHGGPRTTADLTRWRTAGGTPG